MERLKTHVKLGLVVREEADGIASIRPRGHGNYHNVTARLYEDLGFSVAIRPWPRAWPRCSTSLPGHPCRGLRPPAGGPAQHARAFHGADPPRSGPSTGGPPQRHPRQIESAPGPANHPRALRGSRVGVPITSTCAACAACGPAYPGLSPTIRVSSTLGRFLEHSRIYRFENGGASPEFHLGSADWMTRNLSRRMETVAPVCDPAIQGRAGTHPAYLRKRQLSAWDMQPDGHYVRRRPGAGEPPREEPSSFSSSAPRIDAT